MKKLLVLAWAGAALLSGGMLRAENILLSTRNSSLLLTAEKGKTPLFQYFGARVASPDDILASGAAFGDAAYPQFGAQCYREVAIQATHGDGSMSLELAVESVSRDRRDGSETTAIAMKDKHYPFFVTLFYKTYDDCEVIETWTEISHTEKKPVTLYRFASAYMPVRRGDTWLTHFHGTWGAECYLHEEPLTDGMKVLLVDDVMTAGTAVREVIPKLKAEANVEVVGLVLSVDRMEKTKDSDLSAVKAVEAEFGFPVLAIANVREIFDAAAKMKNADSTPLLSHDIQQRAAAYLEEYGA